MPNSNLVMSLSNLPTANEMFAQMFEKKLILNLKGEIEKVKKRHSLEN